MLGAMKAVLIVMMAAVCGCGQPKTPPHRASSGRGGSIVVIVEDQISPAFMQERWELFVDGGQVASCSAQNQLPGPVAPMVAYEGYLSPGEHEVSIVFRHRGHGTGVFSYLKGYVFQSRSKHDVAIGPTGFLTLKAVAYERGGPTTPLEQRPAVRFEESTSVPDPMLPRSCPAPAL
jgi:hypothetical protein